MTQVITNTDMLELDRDLGGMVLKIYHRMYSVSTSYWMDELLDGRVGKLHRYIRRHTTFIRDILALAGPEKLFSGIIDNAVQYIEQ